MLVNETHNCAADAVITSGPAAFAAGQLALGAIHFENVLKQPSTAVLDDAKQCLPSAYAQVMAMEHVRRQLR
jgi:hypothetical protein